MQYDHVGRSLPVSSDPKKKKSNAFLGFLMSMKESEFLEYIQQPTYLSRHEREGYFKGLSRNAGRTNPIRVQVGL
jgi:hypothetical protein